MATHLRYGGSTIERAMRCRASAKAAVPALVPPPGKFAQEGTIAHSVLESALKRGLWDVRHLVGFDGVTADMADGVNVALEYIKGAMRPGDALQTEQFVRYARAPDIAGGTADVIIVREHNGGVNEVIDFKYGFNPVEAWAPQLTFYAVCALGTAEPVVCTVVQPRGFHGDGPVRSWSWSADDLRQFDSTLLSVIEEAEAPLAPYSASIEACRYCPSASICPELQQSSLSLPALRNIRALASGAGNLPSFEEMTVERLVSIVDAAPLMREWLDSAYDALRLRALSGEPIPGKKLVEAQTKRVWRASKQPAEIAKTLSDASGLEAKHFLVTKLRAITEVQADVKRALIDLGLPSREASSLAKSVISVTVDKPASPDLTLVDASDARKEVNRAARDFAGVTFRNDNNG